MVPLYSLQHALPSRKNSSLTFFLRTLRATFGDVSSFLIYAYGIKFIYYFIFESIFKATPEKFLTDCYVTDNEGNTPTFPMLIKRSLYQLIPLESLSFLVRKNLHDTYSATRVLNKKRNPKVEKRYLQFLGTAFLLVLVIYFFSEH
ncbi:RDD family protein [Flavobacterium sp. FlaQc-50]|uniref:RDD family protein n=1 Tax=unclassified Flavobacterium TaxID=196869 RepID=UPI00375660FE